MQCIFMRLRMEEGYAVCEESMGALSEQLTGVPTRLAEDEQRKVVMVMGPHGLQQLLGASGYEAFVKIGYTPEYIARNLGLGRNFKLVLFDKPPELRVATWRVAVEVVSAHYPELRLSFSACSKT